MNVRVCENERERGKSKGFIEIQVIDNVMNQEIPKLASGSSVLLKGRLPIEFSTNLHLLVHWYNGVKPSAGTD